MTQLKGTIFTDGMAVHGSDLNRESSAWQESLVARFKEVAEYGIVNPDSDMKVLPRYGTVSSPDPYEMYISPGVCFSPSMERVEIQKQLGGSPGASFWLQPPQESTWEAPNHLLDPVTGGSLLLGSLLEPNLVWLMYHPEESREALLADLTTTAKTEVVEAYKIMVARASITKSQIPQWFWDNIDRAVLLGVVTPKNTQGLYDAVVDESRVTYAYNRPAFSGVDAYSRKRLNDFSTLLNTFPNCYIERRSASVGANMYGDAYTEVFYPSDVLKDDPLGKYTGTPGAFYVIPQHFPKFLVSAVFQDNSDATTSVALVPRKKVLELPLNNNQVTPISSGGYLRVMYTYYNICEPYLNKSSNPDSIEISQPLSDEMFIVEAIPHESASSAESSPASNAQYPSLYTFFLNKDGVLDVKPRMLVSATDFRKVTPDTVLAPISAMTEPTRVLCYATNGVPGPEGVTFNLVGTDEEGNLVSETVTVTNRSDMDTKAGLGNNGTDWVGFYSTSTTLFASLMSCTIEDNDAATQGATNTNRGLVGFVVSAEDINLLHDLPNCRVTIDAAGDALDWTLEDLRDSYMYQSMLALLPTLRSNSVTSSNIQVQLPAGENVAKYDVLSLRPGQASLGQDPTQGYVYRALAADDPYLPNVVGIANEAIKAGGTGWVLLRGVVEESQWDWTPGVLYLSANDPGKITPLYPSQNDVLIREGMALTFQDGVSLPYLRIQVNGYNFYAGSYLGAPAGTVFTWSLTASESAKNFADAVNGSTETEIKGKVTAVSNGNVVTLYSLDGAVDVGIFQIGNASLEQLVVKQTTRVATLYSGTLENGTSATPGGSDGFYINDTFFTYSTDWTTPTSLAAAILEKLPSLTLQAFSDRVVVSSPTEFFVGATVADTIGYGEAALYCVSSTYAITLKNSTASILNYKPIVRCAQALTATKIIFDPPPFSKKYAAEMHLQDASQLYNSNQVEGALAELPKFVVNSRHPVIAPVAGAAPIFSDTDDKDDVFFIWVSGFSHGQAILNFAAKRSAPTSAMGKRAKKKVPVIKQGRFISGTGPAAGGGSYNPGDQVNGTIVIGSGVNSAGGSWYEAVYGPGARAFNDEGIDEFRTAVGTAAYGSPYWYLTNDNTGSITFRVVPGTPGQISGFKNNPYPDKLGQVLGDYCHLELTHVGSALEKSALLQNPYATADPPDESYEQSDSTTLITTDVASWTNGAGTNTTTDTLEFIDAATARVGLSDSSNGDGGRFYVEGFTKETLIEVAIGEKRGEECFEFVTVGWERVHFFGVEGDKIRFFVAPRCGEPWVYNRLYNNGKDPGIAPAAASPKACGSLDSGA